MTPTVTTDRERASTAGGGEIAEESQREREREREGRHTWSRAHAQNSAVLSLASRWSTSEHCALSPRSQDRTPSIEPRDAAEKRERAVRPLLRRDIV